MMKRVLSAAYTAALFACLAGRAPADPIEASLALTVNPIDGQHEVGHGESDRFNFAPLPLGELTVRRGSESLRVEGLPPIAFNYGNGPSNAVGIRTTRLSILNATFRHAFAGGWFAGAGETVYNQHTDYVAIPPNFYYLRDGRYYAIDGSETQFSRVAGLRIEAGRNVRKGANTFEFGAAANPSMHGTAYLVVPTASMNFCPGGPTQPGCMRTLNTFADGEKAAQADGYARVAHRVSRGGEVLFGVRYINLTAQYTDTGELSDRNVGWAPVLGFRQRL